MDRSKRKMAIAADVGLGMLAGVLLGLAVGLMLERGEVRGEPLNRDSERLAKQLSVLFARSREVHQTEALLDEGY